MSFKLGSEKRNIKTSENVNLSKSDNLDYIGDYKRAPVYRKTLEGGTLAEANMDGSIYVDPKVNLKSKFGKRLLAHEKGHLDDINNGDAAYGDDWVMWKGDIFFRKNIEGVDLIDGPAGRKPAGHSDHPWEQSAIEAEKKA
tara:strand:- start:313 stop:735 length:423 start_codon:yes stop_codon:yes gene_type:complete